MRQDLAMLSMEFPTLRFTGKFPDIAALNGGDATALRPVLTEEIRGRLSETPAHAREVALVVGGNGFVGAHLVARLSREPGIREVWATVRGTPEHTPEQRLDETLTKYKITDIDRDKLVLVDAGPTRPMFGLDADRYRELAERIDLIFNCASSSDYASSYLQLRDDWVLSLVRILHFAAEAKRKHVTYLGSISSYFYQNADDFRRPDSWWYSGYAQMKWVNGELLRWLAHDHILPVTLCESPYVLGATSVGLDPAQHYSWWRIVEIARSIGLLWDGPGMCYVPVDVLVDALSRNALLSEPLPHLLPRNPVPYDNRLLAELLGVELVSWQSFLAEAARQVSPRRIDTVLSSNFDELVRRVDKPPVLPPGHDPSWCDNRRLHGMYLSNITFRDVRSTKRAE